MGLIVTFYSYKGGVGRTMALANIAVILANEGHKVLVVDWDLDSSGLYSYFNADNCEILPNRLESDDGLIQLFSSTVSPNSSEFQRDWKNYIHVVTLSSDKSFTFLSSGNKSSSYTNKLYDFSWKDFYEKNEGAGHLFLQQLREEWKGRESGYDFVLIDSRTGLAESARVCTVDMPDVLIPVFTSNNQSLAVAKVAKAFQEIRKKNSTPLTVYPLPSCIEMGSGHKEEEVWLDRFAESFGSFYRDGWLPLPTERNELDNDEIKQVLRHVAIPKISAFCFGEKLPALNQKLNEAFKKGYNPQGDVTRSYKITAHAISGNFLDLQWLADVTSPEAFETSIQTSVIEEYQKYSGKQLDTISTNPSTTLSIEDIHSTKSKSKYTSTALIGNVTTGFLLMLISLAALNTLGVFNWLETLMNKNPQDRIVYYRADDRSQSAERSEVFKDLQYQHCVSSRTLLKNNDVETIVEFSDRRKIRQKQTIKESVDSSKFCSYIRTKEILLGESQTGTFIIDLIEAILDWDELIQTGNSSSTRMVVTVLVQDEEPNQLKDNSSNSKQRDYLKKLFDQISKKNISLTIMPFKKDVTDRLTELSNGLPNIKICHISKSEEIDACLRETFYKARSLPNLKQ